MSDAGYDVWLSNSRGNKYSHTHENPNITNKEFFSYSFFEMGKYDVPANIEYILKISDHAKVAFVGHS